MLTLDSKGGSGQRNLVARTTRGGWWRRRGGRKPSSHSRDEGAMRRRLRHHGMALMKLGHLGPGQDLLSPTPWASPMQN